MPHNLDKTLVFVLLLDMAKRKGSKRWPTCAAESARMAEYKAANVAASKDNPNEIWMARKLKMTGHKWTRQARWGFRIFDFWCAALGIAVEVDGPEHEKAWDAKRDAQDYEISGIVVLRVRNMNEEDARAALEKIASSCSWNMRRLALRLRAIGGAQADQYPSPWLKPKKAKRKASA